MQNTCLLTAGMGSSRITMMIRRLRVSVDIMSLFSDMMFGGLLIIRMWVRVVLGVMIDSVQINVVVVWLGLVVVVMLVVVDRVMIRSHVMIYMVLVVIFVMVVVLLLVVWGFNVVVVFVVEMVMLVSVA